MVKEPEIPSEIQAAWDTLRSGTVEIIPEQEMRARLLESHRQGSRLKIKFGADPSAPDIHLGHTVPLRKLKQFQDQGHEVIFLVGDFTARIGDPTGRSETRPKLTPQQVEENARTYLEQIFKILDREKTRVVFNAQWLAQLNFEQVIELSSKYTVARMLEREDFKNRFRSGNPIFVHEFLYPLMQGYDSVVLEADVEVGGTDQKFNLLVARELQKEYGQRPQVILTLPLLVGTDGVQKMSKSLDNYIGITEAPGEIFGKLMSIPDELMADYFILALGYPEREVEQWMGQVTQGKIHPRDLKARLSFEVTATYWGEEAATEAQAEFDRVFRERLVPEQLSEVELKCEDGKLWVVRLLVESGLCRSRREARQMIEGGGVDIDGKRVEGEELELPPGIYVVRVGKRRFVRVKLI